MCKINSSEQDIQRFYSGFAQSCKMLSVHSRACSTLSLENLTGEGEWHASRLELNQDSH